MNRNESKSPLPVGATTGPMLPLAAALLTIMLWSGTAVANRYAVLHIDAINAAVVRSMIAGLLALVIVLAFRLPMPGTAKGKGLVVVSGLSSFAIWPLFLSMGVARSSASHAALIMAMLPIFTVIIESMTRRSKPAGRWWAGAGIAFMGTIWLIAASRTGVHLSLDLDTVKGDLFILTGTIICATGYVAGGRITPLIGAPATTFWGLVASLVFLVPMFVLRLDETDWMSLSIDVWIAIGWMALLSSLLGYALWFYALGQGQFAQVASLQLLLPVTTLLAAIVVLGEGMTLAIGVACVAVMSGTFFAHRYARRR